MRNIFVGATQTAGGIFNKKKTSYNHYIAWLTTSNGKFVAQNPQGQPYLNFDNTAIKYVVQGQSGVNYTEFFGNCIVHEMFFHGVLSQSDMDVAKGEFESTFAKRSGVVPIGKKWVQIIDNKMQP